MIAVKVGGNADEVHQGAARYKLFVEGRDDGVDAEGLKVLLENRIDIEVMGPSFHLRSVASALHRHHPTYFFLIDRDHHDDRTVADSWKHFPDPAQKNLLIWRKREFENYFLDPGFLQQSNHIKKSCRGAQGRSRLENLLVKLANKRLFLDVVNRVILTVREEQKRNWIETFSNPDDFPDVSSARQRLQDSATLSQRGRDVAAAVAPQVIGKLFDEVLDEFSAGQVPLVFGHGQWLDRMSGKELFHQLVTTCCEVRDRVNEPVQGRDRIIAVVKDLMRPEVTDKPNDFLELKEFVLRATGKDLI
ncbi:MAG: hypothetical protein HQL82_05190 [Magnetococcales bacterium]|nr:hypothetical protein [Magnetococcales bacterium]